MKDIALRWFDPLIVFQLSEADWNKILFYFNNRKRHIIASDFEAMIRDSGGAHF